MVEDIESRVISVLRRHGVKKAGLFGSYVRGEAGKESDIDILVEVDDDKSLLDFAGIKVEIEESIGKKVDLVEYSTIKPVLRDKILKEQVIII
jgi:uncharacterized protein